MEIRPTYLIMVTENNNNKYYNCFPEGDNFRVEYGRVDATKTVLSYPISKWDHQISSKLAKGYKDVTNLKMSLVEEVSTANPEMSVKQIENESVRRIIEKLRGLARDTVSKNYTVKSSSVTQEMVDEAQAQIDVLLTKKTLNEFNRELIRLFEIIPRRMSDVRDNLAKSDNDFDKIVTKEQDLLDVLRGQIVTADTTPKAETETVVEGKTILEEIGLTMEEATPAEIAEIKKCMDESAYRFRKAWKVTNLETQKRFDDFVKSSGIKKTKLLFHGSRSENWFSIMKTGLKIRPSNAVYTGSMFGDGLYFAPKCQKSVGYTSLSGSYWASGSSNTAYMALFDTAYGTPYDVYDFNSKFYNMNYGKLQSFKSGANCLHAHSSRGMLRNDEIVYYKPEQCTIKYLIEIGN